MEKLLTIDFGSSYTKVALRRTWGTDGILLDGLQADELFSFCVPSAVARVTRKGKDVWVMGEDAIGRSPGPSVQIYENWKAKLFSGGDLDPMIEEVGVRYFEWLLQFIKAQKGDMGSPPVRLCVPKLGDKAAMERRFLGLLGKAGVPVCRNRPCIFEPEANALGILTRGINRAWQHDGSTLIQPHFKQMFRHEKGGLYDKLHKEALQLGHFRYTVLVIDVGSFTVDFAAVSFAVDEGEIDDFNRPSVSQDSKAMGISELDKSVLLALPKEKRRAFEASSVKQREELKRKVYNGEEHALEDPEGGIQFIGIGKEAATIGAQLDAFATRIGDECADFCSHYEVVRPAKVVVTGGGAMIRRLRRELIGAINRRIKLDVYDLLDENEYVDVIPETRIEGIGWRYTDKDIAERRRSNENLVRGATAIGGCCNVIDLPFEVRTRAKRTVDIS